MTRTKQSEKSISAILGTAITHFAQRGYEGARVDAIAEDAGVNKALLYYHFHDKATLYECVLLDVIRRTADAVTSNISPLVSPEEKLCAYIRTFAQSVNSNPSFAPLMLREVASGGATLTREVLQQISRLLKVLRDLLKEGEQAGVLKPFCPVAVHMQIIGSILYFIAGEPIRDKMTQFGLDPTETLTGVTAERAAEYTAGILLNGLRT